MIYEGKLAANSKFVCHIIQRVHLTQSEIPAENSNNFYSSSFTLCLSLSPCIAPVLSLCSFFSTWPLHSIGMLRQHSLPVSFIYVEWIFPVFYAPIKMIDCIQVLAMNTSFSCFCFVDTHKLIKLENLMNEEFWTLPKRDERNGMNLCVRQAYVIKWSFPFFSNSLQS